jgi:hypothetical protein
MKERLRRRKELHTVEAKSNLENSKRGGRVIYKSHEEALPHNPCRPTIFSDEAMMPGKPLSSLG